MPYNMTVSPDFPPEHIAGWYIFNTWLQRQLSESIHLELYSDFPQQRTAIQNNEIDLIYANPFDAAMLVREKGFIALAAPVGHADEAVIAVRKESEVQKIEDLPVECSVASTDDPDINLIGMIMLEPADISCETAQVHQVDTYVLVAKQLIQQKAEVGFFLADAFDNLSSFVSSQLREVIRSQIHDIRHVLLAGPRVQERHEAIKTVLAGMNDDEKGLDVLSNLNFESWEILQQEDTEFMIDLMDTLA
uniref:ABC-type phosphate/phosphonate transport system periplasmic component n=1 Tax=uncultured Thiotrichaceae bacterium TaxID=298394 RepID=A0A6S6UKJ8_9GAMM|nr:MAG: ABC-type phosphate/phosphonate transport system periplasmic component [uncultured Thiotrichaceae bacterium]